MNKILLISFVSATVFLDASDRDNPSCLVPAQSVVSVLGVGVLESSSSVPVRRRRKVTFQLPEGQDDSGAAAVAQSLPSVDLVPVQVPSQVVLDQPVLGVRSCLKRPSAVTIEDQLSGCSNHEKPSDTFQLSEMQRAAAAQSSPSALLVPVRAPEVAATQSLPSAILVPVRAPEVAATQSSPSAILAAVRAPEVVPAQSKSFGLRRALFEFQEDLKGVWDKLSQMPKDRYGSLLPLGVLQYEDCRKNLDKLNARIATNKVLLSELSEEENSEEKKHDFLEKLNKIDEEVVNFASFLLVLKQGDDPQAAEGDQSQQARNRSIAHDNDDDEEKDKVLQEIEKALQEKEKVLQEKKRALQEFYLKEEKAKNSSSVSAVAPALGAAPAKSETACSCVIC
jgi:hypothetical protein